VVEHSQGPGSGARDNGLRCAGYLAVGDLDPRVADALLESLRDEGIAAYVSPTPAARGGYLEVAVPARLTDRLYADSERVERAAELLAATPSDTATEPDIDFDAAWQQLLGSLQSSPGAPAAQGPGAEELTCAPSAPMELPDGGDPALEDHFVPPPPPPLPRLRPVTVVSLLSILAGLVVLATGFDGGALVWLAVLAILGGVVALVYHLKDEPPADSGWDDGAVV
jgi:hypothetical protein